jgi:hypothetical protein
VESAATYNGTEYLKLVAEKDYKQTVEKEIMRRKQKV